MPLFRELVVGFDPDTYPMMKLLDQTCSVERHLILLAMELCSQLYLKDVEIDFTTRPLTQRIVQPEFHRVRLPDEESKV